MKKTDLGQMISILANFGVIAGIVLLAFEINQNNALLASQARSNLFSVRAAMQRDFIQNAGGIVDLIYKERLGEELTVAEERRLITRRSFVLANFEYIYHEAMSGVVPERSGVEALPAAGWAGFFVTDPALRETWDREREGRDPRFVRFMEENVLNR